MTKDQERQFEVAEMKMLRWMCGHTRLDNIKDEVIRNRAGVNEIGDKIRQGRVKWYGHVMRREDEYVGRQAMEMEVKGQRGRGRPKMRWKDNITRDMKEAGLKEGDWKDRRQWRKCNHAADPAQKREKA